MPRDDHQVPQRLRPGSMVRQWFESAASVLLGALTAIIEFLFFFLLLIARGVTVIPGLRTNRVTLAVDRWAMRLSAMELRRLSVFRGEGPDAGELTLASSRRYIAMRWLVGVLGGGMLVMFLLCLAVAVSMVTAWALDGDWGIIENSRHRVDVELLTVSFGPGVVLLFATAVGISGVAALDRLLAVHLLGTTVEQVLRRRVEVLTSTRAAVVDAINDERRRIERDLHDGVQQRLVALGMLVGRAQYTATGQVSELLQQAQASSQEAIAELRQVASRIYPAMLDEAGLHAALESLAERTSVPVRLTFELPEQVGRASETVIYFVVSEAVTNATKHAEPTLVQIDVRREADDIHVTITDDGKGGADALGSGLTGLARRVDAVDGAFDVHSPAGGPTVVSAILPID